MEFASLLTEQLGQAAAEGAAPRSGRLDGSVDHRSEVGPIIPREEWTSLKKDDRVAVQRGAGPATTGSVDIVAQGGSVFWVHLDHGCGRVAIHAEDEVSVWWER